MLQVINAVREYGEREIEELLPWYNRALKEKTKTHQETPTTNQQQ